MTSNPAKPMTEAERTAADVMRTECVTEGVITTADPESFDRTVRAVVAAVRPLLAAEIEGLAAKLRAGFPEGPGADTASYIGGIETAARLVREGRSDADPA